MYLAIQIVLVITSVLMSLFVLLHKGKGGGLSSLCLLYTSDAADDIALV